MESSSIRALFHPGSRLEVTITLSLAVTLGIFVASGSLPAFIVLTAGIAFLALTFYCIQSPRIWLYGVAATALVIPPFYPSTIGGNIPIYVSNLLFLISGMMLLVRFEEFSLPSNSLSRAAFYFLMSLAISLPFAYWFSGPDQATQSFLRFLLILQPFLTYLLVRGFFILKNENQLAKFFTFLLWLGALSALYGIIDFYYPLPVPHPFADQFIYLKGERIRRAQGVFYEASSFGNLCAFFLSFSLFLLYSLRRRFSTIGQACILVSTGIFTIALFLSYSRGCWLNVLVTGGVFILLQRKIRFNAVILLILLTGGFLFLFYRLSPELIFNFFDRRLGALMEFWSDPNLASSGRWENWTTLITYFSDHPWLLLFGIGYKTIPFTNLFGKEIIADNGYLSSLFETGILGMVAFLYLNRVILRLLHKCRLRSSTNCSLYASFLLAFWCGEMVQMVTGDIFTYWRNMIVFLAMMAGLFQLCEPLDSLPQRS